VVWTSHILVLSDHSVVTNASHPCCGISACDCTSADQKLLRAMAPFFF